MQFTNELGRCIFSTNMVTSCSVCRTELPDNFHDGTNRLPCPNCGSTVRAFVVNAQTGHFKITGSALLTFVTYPQRLILLAQKLCDDGEHTIAVIVAHLAADIAASRKLTDAFGARGVADLEEPVSAFFSGSSLGNEHIRNLYTALTCDKLVDQPFWPTFKLSAKKRNQIVHEEVTASETEAQNAIGAATALIKHLGKWGDTA